MGEQIETLEDLLRPDLRAVCIGINPAPPSVAAGHYYQGELGQRLFARLRRAELISPVEGWEDDAAYASGIGFTDIVKRPTARADQLRSDEFAYGTELLVEKLKRCGPQLIVFTFKKTATVLLGPFAGAGFVGRELAGSEVFVMPGPFERRDVVTEKLAELRERIGGSAG